MDTPEYDIVISGAGPVGAVLALLLAAGAARPERIALLGRQPRAAPAQAPATDTRPSPASASIAPDDPRTLALNHGSRELLEQLGAWPDRSASIETVHVSQRGRLGRTLIRHEEFGVPRLGSVVAYDALMAALRQALAQSGVALLETAGAAPEAGGPLVDAAGRRIEGAIRVQSDGARPRGLRRDYGQHAVLAAVRPSRPRSGWAYERFTSQGPLAMLPHPQGDDCYGVVWCCHPEQAQALAAMPDDGFAAALGEAFGERLGSFQCAGARHVFPLALHAGPSLLGPHAVAIGNAAQTLHPVAGQGLNLGLRDAAQLAQALRGWLPRPEQDPAPVLADFARRRRADRWLTSGLTDLMPRVFATRNPLVEHAGGLALLALDLSASLRAPLARHLLQGLRS